MKTTIDIADTLLSEAKRVAAQEQVTLRQLMEEGLRLALRRRTSARPFRLRDASVDGRGVQPGVAEGDWSHLRELIYAGRGD